MNHDATISTDFIDTTYNLECSCGYTRTGLVSMVAAHEVLRAHGAGVPDQGSPGDESVGSVLTTAQEPPPTPTASGQKNAGGVR